MQLEKSSTQLPICKMCRDKFNWICDVCGNKMPRRYAVGLLRIEGTAHRKFVDICKHCYTTMTQRRPSNGDTNSAL